MTIINGFVFEDDGFKAKFGRKVYSSFEEMISDEEYKDKFDWTEEPSCSLSMFTVQSDVCYALNLTLPYYGYGHILCRSYSEYQENFFKIMEASVRAGTTLIFNELSDNITFLRNSNQ